MTLTTAATDYNLKTLILAVPNIIPVDGYFPFHCRELTIQHSVENAAGALLQIKEGIGGPVGIDLNVPGSSHTYRAGNSNTLNIKDFTLASDTDATKVNVSITAR